MSWLPSPRDLAPIFATTKICRARKGLGTSTREIIRTTGDKGKLFVPLSPLFTLFLLHKTLCSLCLQQATNAPFDHCDFFSFLPSEGELVMGRITRQPSRTTAYWSCTVQSIRSLNLLFFLLLAHLFIWARCSTYSATSCSTWSHEIIAFTSAFPSFYLHHYPFSRFHRASVQTVMSVTLPIN